MHFIKLGKKYINLDNVTTIEENGYLENETEKIILHQKYKRCISQAELCSCMQEQCGILEIKKWEKREKKWREIANEFKE